MREPIAIEPGKCGCPRFIIARSAENGDTITAEHTAECRAALAEPQVPAAQEKPKKK